jgi:outer membrane protein assembly factor BamB
MTSNRRTRNASRLALAALVAVLPLAGCKWLKSPSKDNIEPPTPLTELKGAPVQKLWSKNLGKGVGKAGLRLRPVAADGRLYASDIKGGVFAVDAGTGAVVWKAETKTAIGSGPGAGEGLVAVGSSRGEVIALDAGTGAERWRANVSSEVIAAPAVGRGLVVVRAHDGRIYGLDAKDGARRWVFDRGVPLLSLRGNGSPVLVGDNVAVGYDNGKIIELKLSDGTVRWEQALATSEGRTELQRMVDVDGDLGVGDTELFAASYQGQIGALALDTGRQIWAREFSAYAGVAYGAGQVFASDADGAVWALDGRSGASMWKQDALAHRWLSGPALVSGYVVVGDLEGYVHWLKADTGELAARAKIGSGAVMAAPLVVGDTVIVANATGDLAAYRLTGG